MRTRRAIWIGRASLTWPAERAGELPRDRFLGIATGTQGETRAALARLARGEHSAIHLGHGDTVIISSRVIPGHEPEVYDLMGDLIRLGVHLRTWISDRAVHVSGHAHAGEQRRMIELVRPRSFAPLHGTLHHLHRHAELARACGIANVTVLENGDVGVLDGEGLRKDGRVLTGRVHRWAGREIASHVVRERKVLAQEGVALIVVPVDERGEVAGDVRVATRGVMGDEIDIGLGESVKKEVCDAVRGLPDPRVSGKRTRPSKKPYGSPRAESSRARWGSSR